MQTVKNYKFWFCTGSQDLYGDECLEHVEDGRNTESVGRSSI